MRWVGQDTRGVSQRGAHTICAICALGWLPRLLCQFHFFVSFDWLNNLGGAIIAAS
jgi:hypothetical protein